MNKPEAPANAGKKPGLLQRLFGRGEAPAATPAAATPQAEPLVRAPDAESEPTASAPEPTAAQLSRGAASPVSQPAEAEPEATPPAHERRSSAADAPEASPAAAVEPLPGSGTPPKTSWWNRLKSGLSRSSSTLGQGIVDLFTKKKLDETTLEDLEDVLIQADLGVATASRIADAVGRSRYEKGIDAEAVKQILAGEVEKVLAPVAVPFTPDPAKKPFVVLVVGVNGSGKTTTIGKLAARFAAAGNTMLLAAGDTFRAAAIEQLKIWGERVGAEVVARPQGADAAGLAFDALTLAKQKSVDLVLMDTAGRLQNRAELMAELEKIVRVMRKVDGDAPHAVLLVLDATVGQNALNQVEIFGRTVGVTGLVMTKLDGTARGGILVAIAEKFGLPVHFIGVGETQDDLEPFAARDFARAIAGLEN